MVIGLRINSLKISAKTRYGEFGTFLEFIENGLNIIRADNKSGKSTIINALLYVLGAEELLDGKNEGVMKPVLREALMYGNKEVPVIESKVIVQISNSKGEVVTITRYIKSSDKDTKLLEVVGGPNLSNPSPSYSINNYYVHIPGAATDKSGFHPFLADFIGWQLPEVPSYNHDEDSLLYLQTLFPAFFKEQLFGWMNFFHFPIPFGIKELSKRVTEFILEMDIINNIGEKDRIQSSIKQLKKEWESKVNEIFDISRHANVVVEDLSTKPHDVENLAFQYYLHGGKLLNLEDAIIDFKRKANAFDKEVRTVGEDENDLEKEIIDTEGELSYWHHFSLGLLKEISLERVVEEDIKFNIRKLTDDLGKNKESKKLYDFGAKSLLPLSIGQCPTCLQQIKDSLLPQEYSIQPMSFEENIRYIEDQLKTLKFGLEKTQKLIDRKMAQLKTIEYFLRVGRKKVRVMKSELSQHPDLPSKREINNFIEDRIALQRLEDVRDALDRRKEKLALYFKDWNALLDEEAKLPKDLLSVTDLEKLKFFEQRVKEHLEAFHYESVAVSQIEVSRDRYSPVVKGFKTKTDSSASDHIRMIWAYTIALLQTSQKFGGNHPNFLVLDEPGQQQMAVKSLKSLITELIQINGQTIIATSLDGNTIQSSISEQSEDRVRLIDYPGKIIEKIQK